ARGWAWRSSRRSCRSTRAASWCVRVRKGRRSSCACRRECRFSRCCRNEEFWLMSRRSDAAVKTAEPGALGVGRRSVTRRVTLSFLVVTLAFSLVTGWNVFALRAATQEAELMRSGYLPLALALRDAVLGQETWSTQLNHVTAAKNPADTRVWLNSWLAVGRPRAFLAIREALSLAFGKQGEELQRLGHRLEA